MVIECAAQAVAGKPARVNLRYWPASSDAIALFAESLELQRSVKEISLIHCIGCAYSSF